MPSASSFFTEDSYHRPITKHKNEPMDQWFDLWSVIVLDVGDNDAAFFKPRRNTPDISLEDARHFVASNVESV